MKTLLSQNQFQAAPAAGLDALMKSSLARANSLAQSGWADFSNMMEGRTRSGGLSEDLGGLGQTRPKSYAEVAAGDSAGGQRTSDQLAQYGSSGASGSVPDGFDKDSLSAYIQKAAIERGMDPRVALRVAASEGLNADPAEAWQSSVVKNGKRERSYGPFQLYIDGGMGNDFMDQTGLDPRDPKNVYKGIDFALDQARKGGWSPWYGAANVGIGNWDGIPR